MKDFYCPDQYTNPESHVRNLTETEVETKTESVQPTCKLMSSLLVNLLNSTARLPTQATYSSAEYDLYSVEKIIIPLGTTKPVNTGIASAIPQGTYARVAPRSGLSVKGLALGAEVMDSDFRGSIKAV